MTIVARTLLTTLLGLLPLAALAAPQITIEVVAEQEITEVDDNGQSVTRRVAASTTAPGDTLYYTIQFRNSGDEAARNVRIDNPIPDGTAFVSGSAWGDNSNILYSIDQGQTFKKASSLTYQVERNGSVETRQASPEQYNAIRWTVQEIPAAGAGNVGFTVTVQ